jgi:hypothetical protein
MYNLYAKKAERWMPPTDDHDTVSMDSNKSHTLTTALTPSKQTNQYLPDAHQTMGDAGVSISLPGYSVPMDERVVSTPTLEVVSLWMLKSS